MAAPAPPPKVTYRQDGAVLLDGKPVVVDKLDKVQSENFQLRATQSAHRTQELQRGVLEERHALAAIRQEAGVYIAELAEKYNVPMAGHTVRDDGLIVKEPQQ